MRIDTKQRWREVLILFLILWGIMSLVTVAGAEKRVAFVVGIDTYDELGPTDQLKNAVNDATAVAAKLEALGFKVNFGTNLTRKAFNVLWDKTLNQIEGGETLVVFFSGHGVELEGRNYLLPRDVPYTQQGRSTLLQRESLSLNILLDDLSMGDRLHPQVSVVMLDACRDNPFVPEGLRSVGARGGLASVEAPDGIFVMYAAASRMTAFDRLPSEKDIANSLFTRTLLPLISRADLSIQELSTRVKDKVWTLADEAGYVQRPTYYDGIIGRFCLPGCVEPPVAGSGSSGHRTTSRFGKPTGKEDLSKSLEAKGGPRMVAIPGGTFLMGSPETEEGRYKDEGPQHHVTVPAFELGETEVTFAEWDRCVSAGACSQKKDQGWGRGARPVINVSWNDIQTYIAWLNARVGLTGAHAYRLPSEAEWEYAAKSGANQELWAGTSEESKLRDYAVYKANSGRKTAEVRSKKPNAFGLYGLSGNVWEWVQDCYVDSYQGAPTDGLAHETAAGKTCEKRSLRGGGWNNLPQILRSAFRDRYHPGEALIDTGFRLARTP